MPPPGSAAPNAVPPGETGELLAISRNVFRQHGHTATTRDVAKAAGISQAVLYQRFKTKDVLFYAALTQHVTNLSALSDLDPALEPRAWLALFAARAKDHFRNIMPSLLSVAAHPKYGQEMMGNIHRHNRAGEITGLLVLRLHAWREAGQIGPADPRAFAFAFIHALHSMAMVEVLSGDTTASTRPAELAAFIDVFWSGLKPVKAKPARQKK